MHSNMRQYLNFTTLRTGHQKVDSASGSAVVSVQCVADPRASWTSAGLAAFCWT